MSEPDPRVGDDEEDELPVSVLEIRPVDAPRPRYIDTRVLAVVLAILIVLAPIFLSAAASVGAQDFAASIPELKVGPISEESDLRQSFKAFLGVSLGAVVLAPIWLVLVCRNAHALHRKAILGPLGMAEMSLLAMGVFLIPMVGLILSLVVLSFIGMAVDHIWWCSDPSETRRYRPGIRTLLLAAPPAYIVALSWRQAAFAAASEAEFSRPAA